jgi:helix-turn-helix, Psq domain
MSRKTKTYTKATLEVALQAIESGEMKICKASEIFKIPRMTLYNKKNKRHSRESPGAPTKLLKAEEEALQAWIFERGRKAEPCQRKRVQPEKSSKASKETRQAT